MGFAPMAIYPVTRPEALTQAHIKHVFTVLEPLLGEERSTAQTRAAL